MLREHRSRQASRNLRLVHADALVFTTSRGKPQSRRNALRAVQAAAEVANLNSDGRDPWASTTSGIRSSRSPSRPVPHSPRRPRSPVTRTPASPRRCTPGSPTTAGRKPPPSSSRQGSVAEPWQQWQHSAFAQVRSRSGAVSGIPANRRFQRTGANGCERSRRLCKPEVAGSIPARSTRKGSGNGAFRVLYSDDGDATPTPERSPRAFRRARIPARLNPCDSA
jgi:hypothetical protein